MQTHFASAARASACELNRSLGYVNAHPVMHSLLEMVEGLLAILNEQRQILAVNTSFLRRLGLSDAGTVLGVRVGEALKCIHADEMPGGCGTSEYCSTCGAAIAIVTALDELTPQEQRCVVRVKRDGHTGDVCFAVRAQPITYADERFILVFLRDITAQEERAALERLFYHDLANITAGIQGIAENIADAPARMRRRMEEQLAKLCMRLGTEVSVQRALARGKASGYHVRRVRVPIAGLLKELGHILDGHPAMRDRRLEFDQAVGADTVESDRSLLLRVLLNMATNALEHTPAGGVVRMWVEADDDSVTFCVWNEEAIPPGVARRVFQRYFTTKRGEGHGLGAFAMKLLGEAVLGGQVDFDSDAARGTTFRLRLPR
jgi:signal transduction histidine kinase